MNGFAAGRIAGVPVYFDRTFALLVVLFASSYLRVSTPEGVIIGVFAVIGGVASILLHELAHAGAARLCGVAPLFIELHGFGGACHFNREAEKRGQRVFVTLAGPAANFALWGLLHWLAAGTLGLVESWSDMGDIDAPASGMMRLAFSIYMTFTTLANLNIGLCAFNLLPSFPLDGGKAFAEYLSGKFDLAVGTQVVGVMGFGVSAFCLYMAVTQHAIWMLVLAYSLLVANQQALATLGSRKWRRWN